MTERKAFPFSPVWLDGSFSLKAVILAFPLVFAIHDLEEVFTMEQFVGTRLAGISLPGGFLLQITTAQFALSVLILLAGVGLVAGMAARCPTPGRWMTVYVLGVAAFFGNALTHAVQAAVLRGYTPGVVTAILVSLPYAWIAFRRIDMETLIPRRIALPVLLLGLVLQTPLALLALGLGKWLLG